MSVDLTVHLGRLLLKNPIATALFPGVSRPPRTPRRSRGR
jgi:hypothetical protein